MWSALPTVFLAKTSFPALHLSQLPRIPFLRTLHSGLQERDFGSATTRRFKRRPGGRPAETPRCEESWLTMLYRASSSLGLSRKFGHPRLFRALLRPKETAWNSYM